MKVPSAESSLTLIEDIAFELRKIDALEPHGRSVNTASAQSPTRSIGVDEGIRNGCSTKLVLTRAVKLGGYS